MLCAPRKWGKSSAIDLIGDFFSVPRCAASVDIPTHQHPLLKVFQLTKLYRRFQHTGQMHIFNEHFGKYPVVLIDLYQITCHNLEELRYFLTELCEDIFQRYKYISNIPTENEELNTIIDRIKFSIKNKDPKKNHI